MQNWISPLGGSTEGSFLPKAKGPYECYKKFQVLSNFTVLHQDFREKERRKKGNRLSVGNKERSYPTTPFLHSPTSKHCGISYGRLRSHSHGFVCAFKENTTKVTFDKAVFSSFYPSMWKKKRDQHANLQYQNDQTFSELNVLSISYEFLVSGCATTKTVRSMDENDGYAKAYNILCLFAY